MASHGKVNSKAETQLLLLVEGVNDCHAVFQIMWAIYKKDPPFGIHECGNDEGVLESLSARIVEPQPRQQVLGIVLDADIDGIERDAVIKARLDQIRARVGSRYDVPDQISEEGLVIDPRPERPDADRLPKLGIWLMPNNKTFGMLEDVLSASLLDHFREYTEKVVTQAKTDQIASYRDAHKSKAIIRTLMSWQDPPDVQYIGDQKEHIRESRRFLQNVCRLARPSF